MEKMEKRKSFIPDPEYDEPHKFYHTIDAHSSPTKGNYQPKTVKPPNFEVMGNRRRTDTSYVKMRTTTARDNAMYRITDTWNLDFAKETSEPSKN